MGVYGIIRTAGWWRGGTHAVTGGGTGVHALRVGPTEGGRHKHPFASPCLPCCAARPPAGIFFLDAPKGQEALTALFGVASIGFMVSCGCCSSSSRLAWRAAVACCALGVGGCATQGLMTPACSSSLTLPPQVVSSVINLALPFVSPAAGCKKPGMPC